MAEAGIASIVWPEPVTTAAMVCCRLRPGFVLAMLLVPTVSCAVSVPIHETEAWIITLSELMHSAHMKSYESR